MAMPMTMPMLRNGRGSTAIEPPAALMAAAVAAMSLTLKTTCRDGVLQVVGVAMHDHDRPALVGLGRVDGAAEVHEDLGASARHRRPPYVSGRALNDAKMTGIGDLRI